MRIAIIDDSADDGVIIANYLCRYFHEVLCPESTVIEKFESGEQFIAHFAEGLYELILIDYFMHTMNGLDTARKIRQLDSSVSIIFITASRDYAIDCYKVRASDYIVKPVTYTQIVETMSLLNLNMLLEKQCIQIACGREQLKVFLKDIIYCDASGHYVQIHARGCSLLRSRISFERFIKTLLPYPQFLVCYRGCLVNMDHMIRIENLDFVTSEGEHIPIRQKDCGRLSQIYYNYIFSKVRSNQ
ncbi:MAG: response regulator transcription factor [Lachnospiraceae bacterium]|nr:response regulator transcription factor [Lachnospiraceae bacterium]MDE6184182.1 response regulator transcription factor [Lachnospiraceae bacterium]